MKQFIKNYLHDPDVHGGTNMWMLMYLVGSLLAWFIVNPIMCYVYNVMVIPLRIVGDLSTDSFTAFDHDQAIPNASFLIMGIIIWCVFTIWWVIDGIKEYNKHINKHNR